MSTAEFYKLYKGRVRAYAQLTRYRSSLPSHMVADLEQAAWLGVATILPLWDPEKGRSVFNWCAPTMLKFMRAEVHRFYHARPYTTCFSKKNSMRTYTDSCDAERNPDLRIDLNTIVEQLPPREGTVFLMRSLYGASGPELGHLMGVTRQRIDQLNQAAKAALETAYA